MLWANVALATAPVNTSKMPSKHYKTPEKQSGLRSKFGIDS
jgi:hypothetical protein